MHLLQFMTLTILSFRLFRVKQCIVFFASLDEPVNSGFECWQTRKYCCVNIRNSQFFVKCFHVCSRVKSTVACKCRVSPWKSAAAPWKSSFFVNSIVLRTNATLLRRKIAAPHVYKSFPCKPDCSSHKYNAGVPENLAPQNLPPPEPYFLRNLAPLGAILPRKYALSFENLAPLKHMLYSSLLLAQKS